MPTRAIGRRYLSLARLLLFHRRKDDDIYSHDAWLCRRLYGTRIGANAERPEVHASQNPATPSLECEAVGGHAESGSDSSRVG